MEQDGQSTDPAMWHDWLNCIRAVKGASPLKGDTFGAYGRGTIHTAPTDVTFPHAK